MSPRTASSAPIAPPLETLLKVLNATRGALDALEGAWDLATVSAWADQVIQSRGRVVLCGMGKSGLVAQKIAATLASTGCPSFFLHPAEALHGDLGMVTEEDTLLILSNSGEAQEILNLLPSLLRLKVKIAAITSRTDSRLAQASDWCFTYRLPGGEGLPPRVRAHGQHHHPDGVGRHAGSLPDGPFRLHAREIRSVPPSWKYWL